MDRYSNEVVPLVSTNRPLTRAARDDLKQFGIVSTKPVHDYGRWTEIEVEKCPPRELLEKHEIAIDADADVTYRSNSGDLVRIYETFEEKVIVDGVEATISPSEAREHAESEGWEVVE